MGSTRPLSSVAWTLGSIAQFARVGACSVTYYETTGWRGVVPSIIEPPPSRDWPGQPGSVYPLYHVLADVRDLATGPLVALEISQPHKVLGLASRGPRGTKLLLANLTDHVQIVCLEECGQSQRQLRMLDEKVLTEATSNPVRFRTNAAPLQVGPILVLNRYAVVRVDDLA